MTEMVKLKVRRSNPKKDKESRYETYEVPYIEGMTVGNALDYIKDNIDGSIAYYVSCRIGKCLGCTVTIDGKNSLFCTTPLTQDMTIEPLRGHRVIKDLVTVPRSGT